MDDMEKYSKGSNYQKCAKAMTAALEALREAKPNDRSSEDRYYQITITDLEKVLAYYTSYV